MKAWVLEGVGEFEYREDVNTPEPLQDEVIVKVKAVGICGSDIPRIYQNGAHKMPLIIGHEFSGQVEKIGEKVDKKWKGKRVSIFPLIPCKKCSACLSQNYEMCSDYDYIGSRRDGAFAEYVAVPEWNLIELPDKVTFEQAAMLEPMAVAVHAMRRLSIKKDMTVAVCGLGTIGQLMIMFLLDQNVKNIFAIGNKKTQEKSVIKLGLPRENYYDFNKTDTIDWISSKTGSKMIDVYFDCVGKNETFSMGIDLVGKNGQICIVGNPHSDITLEKDRYWKILRKQLTIIGTWNSSFLGEDDEKNKRNDWKHVIKRLEEGKIRPEKLITHKFPLEKLESGLKIIKDKKEDYTKVMVVDK